MYSNRRSIQNIRLMEKDETIEAYDNQNQRFKDRSTIIRRKLSDMKSKMPELSPFHGKSNNKGLIKKGSGLLRREGS